MILELHRQGVSVSAIARHPLGTVAAWFEAGLDS
jgi:hypothetical protein